MADDDKAYVPIDHPDNVAFYIAVCQNDDKTRWEAHLMIGNLKTEAEAKKAALDLKEVAEKQFGADMMRTQ